MKEFIFLIRINPDQLTPGILTRLHESWQPVISNWIGQNLLVSSLIFRQAGTVLSAGGTVQQDYLREQNDAVTGCFVLKAKDMEEATALGREFPTLSVSGSIEIRELQKFSNEKTI